MKRIDYHIAFEQYALAELPQSVQTLIQKARETRDNAYAVYSGFYVGAALELANGAIVIGSNQENRAYPSGLCAERVAIFAASTQYPDVPFVQLAIAVKSVHADILEPISPCGACRQSMAEYEFKFDKPVTLWLVGNNDTVIKINAIRDLLPLVFTGEGVNRL